MLFPVDHGNSSIKTVNFVFSSGLADYPIRPPVDTDILEYGGIYYRIGEGHKEFIASLICGTRRKMTDILS